MNVVKKIVGKILMGIFYISVLYLMFAEAYFSLRYPELTNTQVMIKTITLGMYEPKDK